MKTLKLSDIEFEIIAEYEDTPVKGCFASGNDEQDKQTEQEIIDKYNNGNIWAWCTIEVKGTYKGILTASDHLGCCSYDSKNDFKANSGYFEDMCNTVLEDIQTQLKTLND